VKLSKVVKLVEKIAAGGSVCITVNAWGKECNDNSGVSITWFSQGGNDGREEGCRQVRGATMPEALAAFKAEFARVEAERKGGGHAN
jgi:hypothetical protein